MSNIKKLKDIHGNDIYPITTTDAVFTSGGQSVSEYLSTSLNLLIQQIQNYEAKNEEVRQKLMDMLDEAGLTYDPNSSITDLLNRFLPANSGDGDESLSYDVKRISCGEYFTYILKNDTTAYYAGLNNSYQLGINNNTDVSSLTQLTSSGQVYFTIDNIKQISCGGKHTFALKNDGTLWAAGANGYGQLGLGDTSIKEMFLQVTRNINNDVKQIEAGYVHSVLLKNDGTVWSCGGNDYGQLGLSGTFDQKYFNQVTSLSDIIYITCSAYNTYALSANGDLYGAGFNSAGQLGLGNQTNSSSFVRIATNVKRVAAGSLNLYYLKNDGTLWSTGDNGYGQLGINTSAANSPAMSPVNVTTNVDKVKDIACCMNQTVYMLKTDGTVWSCGRNDYGQLGMTGVNNTVFNKIPTLSNIVDIFSTLSYCAFALQSDGTVWSWGQSKNGETGLGTGNVTEPRAISINLKN